MKRFFVEHQEENGFFVLEGEEHTHLSKVLRLKVGEVVQCFFDGSQVYNCEIVEILKNSTKLKIIDKTDCLQNQKTNLTLFQAMPKLDKLENVCQKLTELGVTQVVPFVSSFCVAKESPNKIERINKIIISACKQCGRTNLLKLDQAVSFKEMLKRIPEFDQVIFACEFEEEGLPLLSCLSSLNLKGKKVAYIVGSEGGFSQEEADRIKSYKNVATISLGKRILRTETASVAIASMLQLVMGEF